MKIEIEKGSSPLSEFFAKPLTVKGEAERQNLLYADDVLALMKKQKVTRTELARRMGVRPSRITAMLSGTANLTTETKVRAAMALGAQYHHCLAPASQFVKWQTWNSDDVHPAFLRAETHKPTTCEVTFEIPGEPANDDSKSAA